jgi:hypothetical protein
LQWPVVGRTGGKIRTIAPNPNRALFGRCSTCAVRSLSICGALDERIARQVHLAPNEALFIAGQLASSVHNKTAGVARLYKLLRDGRRQVIDFALPGDFLGTMPSDRYGFSADAIGAVSACRFPADAFAPMKALRNGFVFESDFEHAIELDPRYVTPSLVTGLREIGINRASLGVQDVNPLVQTAIGRWQPMQDVEAAVKPLREAGIRDLNFDLILRTCEIVASLSPNRIACYGYLRGSMS